MWSCADISLEARNMGYIMEFMILLSKEMYFVTFCPRGFGLDMTVTYCLIFKVMCFYNRDDPYLQRDFLFW